MPLIEIDAKKTTINKNTFNGFGVRKKTWAD
jgi:hypothetical protein